MLLAVAFLFFNAVTLKAQTRTDSAVNNISAKLSVSKEKARQIHDANNYKQAEIEKLLKDNKRKPGDKQRQLQRLLAERRHKIDSTMTSSQKEAMRQHNDDMKQKIAAHQAELMRKHEAEMNNVTHQHWAKTAADSVKKKVRNN